MVHSGRSPAECETSGEATVGQGNKRRTYSHVRDITASLSALIASIAPLPGGKYREPVGHNIRENRRGPKRYTGDEGMVSGTEATERQGSYGTARYSGSHGLAGSSHDRLTRHDESIYRMGSRGSVPSLCVQNHVRSTNSNHPCLVSTRGAQVIPNELSHA
jgi:hypothetical protein